MIKATDNNPLHEVIMRRKSVRAFLDRDVPHDVVKRILEVASRAPSGGNIQPWSIDVLTGKSLEQLSASILDARRTRAEPESEYNYYPEEWFDPFLSRRRKVGWAMYSLIGVEKGDTVGSRAHHDRNFTFFGAPVGMILSVDRRLGDGALIDVGFFLQGIALAAAAVGLGTCMQAAFAPYHQIIRDQLGLDPTMKVLCGIALGYEDKDAKINALHSEREPVSGFARFHDKVLT